MRDNVSKFMGEKSDSYSMSKPIVVDSYFPHIDGLRAIAVLSVLFFHADISVFSGGFVGVDVFFVISGYLITAHLLTGVKNNSFSFKSFYARRARRLLPALVVTVAATFIAGYFIFPAANFERLANSSIFALFSLSNIFFWAESGYFDSSSSLKPLLHMWSLSVEEQFYLVWPALILLLAKTRYAPVFIFAIAMISLILAEYVFASSADTAFFLTPFRIVEFAIGALLVWFGGYKPKANIWMEVVCALGLVFVLVAIFAYSEHTRFPGVMALLPCLGAALLIYSGGVAKCGSVLRSRLLVSIGLISYSLYLVHWPITVFYKYLNIGALQSIDKLLIITTSFILAVFMYVYVEKPFRSVQGKQYRVPSKVFFSSLAASTAMLIALAAHASYNDGWSIRFSDQFTRADIEGGMAKRVAGYGRICEERSWELCAAPSVKKESNVLVIGDSHALDGFNIFLQAYPEYHYTMLELGGCPPLTKQDITALLPPTHLEREKCVLLNEERFEAMAKDDYRVIVISVLFGWYAPEHLQRSIEKIRAHSDAQIIVLGNYIQLHSGFADLSNQGIDIARTPDALASFAAYERELRALNLENVSFISKRSLFCDGDSVGTCRLWFDGVPFSYDQHHLSFEASGYLADQLKALYGSDLYEKLPL